MKFYHSIESSISSVYFKMNRDSTCILYIAIEYEFIINCYTIQPCWSFVEFFRRTKIISNLDWLSRIFQSALISSGIFLENPYAFDFANSGSWFIALKAFFLSCDVFISWAHNTILKKIKSPIKQIVTRPKTY